jgi:cupin 2 domain-containing protein
VTGTRPGNLFAAVPAGSPEEEVVELAAGAGARIERIVSCGQASPPGFWYDQDGAEFVALLQGEAAVEFADGTCVRLRPGDHLTIAAHARHRVAWTSTDPPTIWLAVHYRD